MKLKHTDKKPDNCKITSDFITVRTHLSIYFIVYWTRREEYVKIVSDGVLKYLPTPMGKGVSLCVCIFIV